MMYRVIGGSMKSGDRVGKFSTLDSAVDHALRYVRSFRAACAKPSSDIRPDDIRPDAFVRDDLLSYGYSSLFFVGTYSYDVTIVPVTRRRP